MANKKSIDTWHCLSHQCHLLIDTICSRHKRTWSSQSAPHFQSFVSLDMLLLLPRISSIPPSSQLALHIQNSDKASTSCGKLSTLLLDRASALPLYSHSSTNIPLLAYTFTFLLQLLVYLSFSLALSLDSEFLNGRNCFSFLYLQHLTEC